MSDSPVDLDLRFLPDWLKEGATANRYSDYQGDTGERPRRDDRGPRPGGDRRGPRPAGRGDRPPQRNDRGPGGDRRGPRREGGPRDDRGRGPNPQGDRGSDRGARPIHPPVQQPPAVKVEFLPEPNGVAGIAKQIRASGRAYPLFGTARLFLEKPERHRVRITSLDPAVPLFQCGDGPVSFDQATVERNAFRELKESYYVEEVVQGDPLKGNFTNVARCRSTGMLLGPTNYHGYQPALRKLYEERFSRRMSFPEFQREEIQVVNDEQTVADWKEQARSSTTYKTTQEPEPLSFKSATEVEQHFRKTYLPQLVKSGVALETSGHASRAIGDRTILQALRTAWDQERGFPQNLVNQLRPHFVETGLQFFKHRKRILYVSPIRPQRHAAGEVFSEGIGSILTAVAENPKITRPQLAVKLLGENHDAPEALPKKAALASDLHYLVHAGHVIEFHDGTLDLPLAPNAKPEADEPGAVKAHVASKAQGAAAAVAEPEDEPTASDVEQPAPAEAPSASEPGALTEPSMSLPEDPLPNEEANLSTSAVASDDDVASSVLGESAAEETAGVQPPVAEASADDGDQHS